VVKPGRTLVVCQVDVYSIKESRERHCALMTQTLLTVAGKSDDIQV
jgi:acyl-coenzyme A thioesterase PaaI-like protein